MEHNQSAVGVKTTLYYGFSKNLLPTEKAY